MNTNNEKNFELPFGIDFVIREDLSRMPGFQEWRASGSSYDITCPFCGGKRKMNINTAKNVAKCNKCGGGSGFNTVTLHAALTGLSNSDACKDLLSRWKGLGSDVKLQLKNTAGENLSQIGPAPIEIRDVVYRKLLSELSLSQKHREDLQRRGLSIKQIEEGLYKTIPAVGFHTLAHKAIYETGVYSALASHKYWGIPGFTDVANPEKVSCRGRKNGYFVPVIQKDGLISGMQIRYDNLPEDASEEEKEKYKKYSWYSSSEKETGCSVTGCENIHFAGKWSSFEKDINLTEGVLKADIAAALSGKNFLGLVGVNNISQLRSTLCKLQVFGAENVNLYIDMDYRLKPEVAAALTGIKKEINRAGIHDVKILKDSSFKIFKASDSDTFEKSYKILSDNPLPDSLMLFIDRLQVPQEKFIVKGNRIEIGSDFFDAMRNCEHSLRIVDTTKGFENYESLGTAQRQNLLLSSLIGKITFQKTGLTYREMNWDENYKGIDDYYLYINSLQGKGV